MTDPRLPHLAPQRVDREAVARTLHEYDKYDEWNDEGCNDTGNDQLRYKSCRETYLERADAVLALINGTPVKDSGPVVPDSAVCDHDDVKADDYGAMRCTHCGLVF